MINNKDLAINKINIEFEKLADLTLKQLDILSRLFDSDKHAISDKTLKELEANEISIDKFDKKLDEHIIRTIVLYQPLASDLRQLFAIYRIVQNLERIGDLVIKITVLIPKFSDLKLFDNVSPTLYKMLKITSNMVSKALLSFILKDKSCAIWTIKEDAIIDKLNHKLIRKSIKEIELHEEVRTLLLSLTDLRSIISAIERIGDHATNIAEASIYSLIGTNITHDNVDEIEL
ncbi:MAG: hypothetical protein AUJ98_08565 [Bacteroidetes bacterium CG2_30_33_31]|nr:MAG: hypothetical protein AUJ98_08565 [Bacteroidetes bacterium CG2_30_33_31]